MFLLCLLVVFGYVTMGDATPPRTTTNGNVKLFNDRALVVKQADWRREKILPLPPSLPQCLFLFAFLTFVLLYFPPSQWNYYMSLKWAIPAYVKKVTMTNLKRYRASGLRYMAKLKQNGQSDSAKQG